jgi:hypothetical protein
MATEKDFNRMDLREKERYIRSLSTDELRRFNRTQELLSRTPEQQRNEQRREAERNRYYNDPKARTARANAELDAARKSADRLKPPAPPATSTPSPAKKSAVSKILDKVKGNSGRGSGFGRGGGVGILRLGGGGTASKVK